MDISCLRGEYRKFDRVHNDEHTYHKQQYHKPREYYDDTAFQAVYPRRKVGAVSDFIYPFYLIELIDKRRDVVGISNKILGNYRDTDFCRKAPLQ